MFGIWRNITGTLQWSLGEAYFLFESLVIFQNRYQYRLPPILTPLQPLLHLHVFMHSLLQCMSLLTLINFDSWSDMFHWNHLYIFSQIYKSCDCIQKLIWPCTTECQEELLHVKISYFFQVNMMIKLLMWDTKNFLEDNFGW